MDITQIPHPIYLTLTRDASIPRERLADLTPLEVFDRWLVWHGIIGYSEVIFETAGQLHEAIRAPVPPDVEPTHFYAHPLQAGVSAPGGTLIAITVGERGYTLLHTGRTPIELNPPGTTDEILDSAIAGSMFGWNVPAARLAVAFDAARR